MEPDNDEQRSGINILKNKDIEVQTVPVAINQKKQFKRVYQLVSLVSSKPYQYQQYYSAAMQKAIDDRLTRHSYDTLMVEFSQMGYYRFNSPIPMYVDQHNVEYEIMKRTYETENNFLRKLLASSEYRKYKKQEIENCLKFDSCLTTSARDAEILKEQAPSIAYHVIPNGVDSEFFKPVSTPAHPSVVNKPPVVLFTGTISYYPNTEGIIWFHRNVWPLLKEKQPDATLCIAGKGPPTEIRQLAADDGSITVTGAVDDMRDYYAEATVVIVPLRVGGGTRLKILEGMAMGKAIVSTTVGAEGISHTDGKDILLRDTPKEFCEAVSELINDRDRRALMEAAGRTLVETQYDWKAVVSKLCDIFDAEKSQEIDS
ncbi:hypothetical protein AB833_25045 [Chromatiales bacterium (ex Bugula neritina AB1)]|nr:hypothetical protein AB833_25045 [Chromatiales bacterium (ex Bugula neritina AB1)]